MEPTTDAHAATHERPDDSLGYGATIKGDEDAEKALRELAFIAAADAAITSECEQRCREIMSAAKEQRQVSIGQRSMSFADRRAQLEKAVVEYATENKQAFFPSGKKTRKLPTGVVSYRDIPESVGFVGGVDAKVWANKTDELTRRDGQAETGIMSRLNAYLRRERIGRGDDSSFSLADVCEVTLKPALAKANEQLKSKAIRLEDLEIVSMKRIEGDEKFSAKPSKFVPETDRPPIASDGSSPGGGRPARGQ